MKASFCSQLADRRTPTTNVETTPAKKRSATKRLEQAFQIQVARFLDLAAPDLVWFAVPNATGNRGAHLGGILKAMGLRAGVPDICMIMPTGHIAFLELKAGQGSLSKSQREFRDRVSGMDVRWAQARTLAEVQDILVRWLTPFGFKLKARI